MKRLQPGLNEFGILICSTGVGMSMAANKIPGVRAALVVDEQTAALARQHNNANVLCLGAFNTAPEQAKKILATFLSAQFEGGRHERRISKMEHTTYPLNLRLQKIDPAIADAIFLEKQRQQENIELIASENFVSPAVMEAQGSVLTNKYASRATLANGGMAAAKNAWIPLSAWLSSAPSRFLAPTTPTFNRIPAARRTWPFIFPSSSRAIKC